MIVVTKDYREIDCNLIDFCDNDVLIIHWDGTQETEPISNIDYIKQS
jgi:hypothetical protein